MIATPERKDGQFKVGNVVPLHLLSVLGALSRGGALFPVLCDGCCDGGVYCPLSLSLLPEASLGDR